MNGKRYLPSGIDPIWSENVSNPPLFGYDASHDEENMFGTFPNLPVGNQSDFVCRIRVYIAEFQFNI